ncbi:Lysophosphatidic acid acyltransferase endophilin/SH3GL involved in synaptic vesicle formation protein [Dioscorea alata]|uniref:Lysophosphatidic acid acyltransferase endophilin/SH3GL involved in synaptic vesicle formation protein n=1 Tax=Dioscorea alata TaxID=55571 RepID=A0ACB7WGU1_DIOAL|nr:Lysophosphatidic acid acyltransferase endophilin/SH3GL involved in synaptic vesicle formation protein [Dioscorea alata]
MEVIRKQASKLKEQVAKQQQAVIKQFSGRFGHDSVVADGAELSCHQKLQTLFDSTKAAKHFQRDIVRGVESFISVSAKQMGIVTKLAEDCCKYGSEYQNYIFALPKASLEFGTSHKLMEKEREQLLKMLGDQVFQPLRTMIMSAPLEDARHLTYHYERIRQEVEVQAAEVMRRQSKAREVGANADSMNKLQNAESKLSELRTTLSALGKEATAAMVSVETQQQKITYEKLLAVVDAERAYHHHVADILDKLHDEIVSLKCHPDPTSESPVVMTSDSALIEKQDSKATQPVDLPANGHDTFYFIAEVIHPFDAQADGELSLAVGDYVVVRQVGQNGWSEGECKGKAGWFPSAYVEQRDKAPASKVIDTRLPS